METDRAGRVPVNPDCTVGNRPDIFVIGDLALFKGPDGKPLPGLAPVAMQQGEYVARRDRAADQGRVAARDRSSTGTRGRWRRSAGRRPWPRAYGFQFSGYLAWLAWLFIHIMYLARFENRMLVLFQWFWNYVTRNRTARLITNPRGEPM